MWEWLHEYGGKIIVQFRRMGASLDYRRDALHDGRRLHPRGDAVLRPPVPTRAGSTERTASSTGARTTERRCPISSSCTRTSTTRSRRSATRSRTATATSRSRRCVRRRSRPTSRWRCIPDDERYRHLIGREVVVPWVERRVPVIADERVEREFGTGALKITPGPRSDRLRDRTRPRSAGADVHRPRRPHARRPGPRGADAGRGRGEDPRLAEGARPARAARALPAQRRALRALREPDRAADLAAVVVLDGRSSSGGRSRRSRTARFATTPRVSTASRSTRSRTRPTGASRGSSGGGISCPSGTAPTAT